MMNNKQFFVTATDTDAGKTYVTRLLTLAFSQQNKKVAVFKPIAAGCEYVNGQLQNEDALLLKAVANCDQTLIEINPISFLEPIAPHIAADNLNKKINPLDISSFYQDVLANDADIILTEGAGGWRLPLGGGAFLSEFAQQQRLDVVLVVNMKLGCLNHAILTYQAIKADGLNCVAWVANCQEDMPYLAQNIEELKNNLPMPCIAELTNNKNIDDVVPFLDLTPLLLP